MTEVNKHINKLINESNIRYIISSALHVEVDNVSKIFVDMNSVFSIIFHSTEYDASNITKIISVELEEFILKYLSKKIELIFLFTTRNSQYHLDIFPEWCEERFSRVDLNKSEFIKEVLYGLKKFSEDNKKIKVINTKQFHPVAIVQQHALAVKSNVVVISRDNIFQCMNLDNIIVYNGTFICDIRDQNRVLPFKSKIENPNKFFKYFMTLNGDKKRNGFSGLSGYATKSTDKYIALHKIELELGLEHPEKEFVDKYVKLFDVDEIYKYYINNKEDK